MPITVLAETRLIEIAAPFVFLVCWIGYWAFADQLQLGNRSLMRRMHEYRRA